MQSAGLDFINYDQKWKCYRLKLLNEDIKEHASFLTKLMALAYGLDAQTAKIKAELCN